MKKFSLTPLAGTLLFCSCFTFAGTELDQINAEVETHATQIDLLHGVLLTGQERNDLKIKLVATKVTQALASDETATVSSKVTQATGTYELTDPVDQRQLLIEIQSIQTVRGDGLEPPK